MRLVYVLAGLGFTLYVVSSAHLVLRLWVEIVCAELSRELDQYAKIYINNNILDCRNEEKIQFS